MTSLAPSRSHATGMLNVWTDRRWPSNSRVPASLPLSSASTRCGTSTPPCSAISSVAPPSASRSTFVRVSSCATGSVVTIAPKKFSSSPVSGRSRAWTVLSRNSTVNGKLEGAGGKWASSPKAVSTRRPGRSPETSQ